MQDLWFNYHLIICAHHDHHPQVNVADLSQESLYHHIIDTIIEDLGILCAAYLNQS